MKKLIIMLAISAVCCSTFAAYKSYSEARAAGMKAFKAQDQKELRRIFAEAKTLAKTNGEKWESVYNETRACRFMKQFDDALQILDDFIKNNPKSPYIGNAKFIKGLVYSAKSDYNNAAICGEEAAKLLKPGSGDWQQNCHLLINMYLNLKKYDKCEENAEKLIALPKTSYIDVAVSYASIAKINQKKYDDCVKLLEKHIPSMKNTFYKSIATYSMAQAFDALKKQDEANKYYQMTVDLTPKYWRGKAAANILKKRIKK